MRYAVISDVHSNLEALRAVLGAIDSLGVERCICLGDVVGYNADPNECISIIKGRGIDCVMGNHDQRAVTGADLAEFNPVAREALLWTREQLTEESADFLSGLPSTLTIDDSFLAVHGWVNDLDSYIFSELDAAMNLKLMGALPGAPPLCFFGHTHFAVSYLEEPGSGIRIETSQRIDLGRGGPGHDVRALINPGSVGQPRDLDTRAAFAVYDRDSGVVTLERIEYDIETAYAKVIEAGLPRVLAERLKHGR